MSDPTNVTIDADGVYTNEQGDSIQYRAGTVVTAAQKKALKRVGPFPEVKAPGQTEDELTQPDAKAAPAPENKAEAAPTKK